MKMVSFKRLYLDSRSTRLESKDQLVLLSGELVVDVSDSVALVSGAANVGLSLSNLVLVLLLVLAKLSALEGGLDGQPDLHPLPCLGHHHSFDGALARVQGQLLVLELLELHPGGLATSSRLKPGEDASNLVLTDLLHPSEDTSPEEDLGVAQTELFLVKLDNVHDSASSRLVILGLGHSRST